MHGINWPPQIELAINCLACPSVSKTVVCFVYVSVTEYLIVVIKGKEKK